MRTRDILIACLATGAAAVALYFASGERSQKISLDIYEVLGAVTAEETAKLLGDKGQVLVMARDTGEARFQSVEAELKAFQQTLKKRPGMSVVVERIQIQPMQMMATGGAVPTEQFFRALQMHANLGAVVLFSAFPPLADPEIETLKKTGVKVVVVSSFRPNYEQLLARQAIHLAIVPRPEPPPADAPPARTVRERFDQENLILSSGNASRSP
jgi:hypothetical protein